MTTSFEPIRGATKIDSDFDPLRDIPWMTDGSLVPPVDAADIKSVWELKQKVKEEMRGKTWLSYKYFIKSELYMRADAWTKWYRLAMFESMQVYLFQTGGPVLPSLPNDAVFKAIAVVPIIPITSGHEGIPVDAKELIRLIEEEETKADA